MATPSPNPSAAPAQPAKRPRPNEAILRRAAQFEQLPVLSAKASAAQLKINLALLAVSAAITEASTSNEFPSDTGGMIAAMDLLASVGDTTERAMRLPLMKIPEE